MEFTNDTIDTAQLPKHESVAFTALHPKYWTVVLIRLAVMFAIVWGALVFGILFSDDIAESSSGLVFSAAAITVITFAAARVSYRKKGFAFRNHDVLYRSGVISTNTIVIPYNRIQHVALHEGFISRPFGLAEIQIFTAGGASSDIEIPGIEKQHAENIKQLLMGKIQKQL